MCTSPPSQPCQPIPPPAKFDQVALAAAQPFPPAPPETLIVDDVKVAVLATIMTIQPAHPPPHPDQPETNPKFDVALDAPAFQPAHPTAVIVPVYVIVFAKIAIIPPVPPPPHPPQVVPFDQLPPEAQPTPPQHALYSNFDFIPRPIYFAFCNMAFAISNHAPTVFCHPVHGQPFVLVPPFPPFPLFPVLNVSSIVDQVVLFPPLAPVTPAHPVPPP